MTIWLRTRELVAVFTAADIPGRNWFGVIVPLADQPVFAEREVRFRGEAVALVVGDNEAMDRLDPAAFPIEWNELPALMTPSEAMADGADLLHRDRQQNVLIRGLGATGRPRGGFARSDIVVEGEYSTGFIEHAYIEPEAGFAIRDGDRVEVHVTTQTPHMDLIEVAEILDLDQSQVRIVPTCSGRWLWGQARHFDPAVSGAGRVAPRPPGADDLHQTGVDDVDHQASSRADDNPGRTESGPGSSSRWISSAPSTPVPTPPGDPPWPTGSRSTPAAPMCTRHTGPGPRPSTPTARHRGHFAGSAYRRRRSPRSACSTKRLTRSGSIDSSSVDVTPSPPASPPSPARYSNAGVGYVDCLEALRPTWERAREEAADFN